MAGSEMVKTLTEDIYPFELLPDGSKVVDVGGSRGHVSVRIAEKVPGLSFVVQDDEGILEAGQAEGISEQVKERVDFMPHDFFAEQPVKGAEVYLLRFILHDHPDALVAFLFISLDKVDMLMVAEHAPRSSSISSMPWTRLNRGFSSTMR